MKVGTVVGSITVALVLCSSALAATNPNQQGLSQAQIDQGCTMKGRYVSCPSQMRRIEAAPMKRVEAAPIQRVEAGGIQRSALVGKWSGTYICGQGETNVDIDVDENLNGTIRCFASNSRLGPFDGYFKGKFSINGSSVTFRPNNRNVDGWRIPPGDGGRGWSTYGFNANLDTAGKTLDGNILLQGCSTISLFHSASGVPHAMDVNQNTSAENGAHQATNSNQKGMGFAYAEGNAVEPISNGLSLRWGSNEVRQQFGEPEPSSISCAMNYGVFKFEQCYGTSSSRLYINGPDVKLSSGIGVGSSKADVASVFGNSYGSKLGSYTLDFKYSGDRVSRISIDYDARADAGQAPIGPPPTPQPGNSSGLAGMYWCIAPTWSKGTINLLPNGTYQMNGAGVAGRYKAGRGQVHFNGALKDWNKGVARIEDGNLIFEWKNSDGSMQYFAYRKGSS